MSAYRMAMHGLLILAGLSQMTLADAPRADLVLVQGAAGEARFAEEFSAWAQCWRELASAESMLLHTVDSTSDNVSDRKELQDVLAKISRESPRPLWLVLIGHGTWFENDAKFNLVGPDVTARELKEWLQLLSRPVAIVNCASCSGPFIDRLTGGERVVVTATRSGDEHNFAHFGRYLAEVLQDRDADLDHDESISLLEAFIMASKRTQSFYDDEGRLAAEHALLDDNGDGRGSPASFFRGVRVAEASGDSGAVDGTNSHRWILLRGRDEIELTREQQETRDQLESTIESLRREKAEMEEGDYYRQLETYFVQLARLYQTDD